MCSICKLPDSKVQGYCDISWDIFFLLETECVCQVRFSYETVANHSRIFSDFRYKKNNKANTRNLKIEFEWGPRNYCKISDHIYKVVYLTSVQKLES